MIFTLYNKYFFHNQAYLRPGCYYGQVLSVGKLVPCGNPQLLDLLSTGHPYPIQRSTFKGFTDEQYQDMEQIVRLMPRSLLCNIGQLGPREFITPFIVACDNPNIPVKAIEFLLQNGANPNSIFNVSGNKMHILTDLRKCNRDRYEQLKPILEKYGAVEKTFSIADCDFFGRRGYKIPAGFW